MLITSIPVNDRRADVNFLQNAAATLTYPHGSFDLAHSIKERTAVLKRVNVEGIPRLPLFSHAVVAGDFIHVSGTLGLKPGTFELVEGGIGPQTVQALRHMENILAAAGATLRDVVKVNVYLADAATFDEMNKAYASVLTGDQTPARMTIGGAGLNFGAAIEIECTAYKPRQ